MIGKNIRDLRARKGISQDRLSKLTDLSLNTIVKVESGRNSNPTIDTLGRIARVFNVKVDELIKVWVIVALAGAFSLCYAEEQARVITLSSGIQAVLKDNRLIKITFSDKDMAFEDSLIARSALLPHINGNLSETFLKFQPQAKFDTVKAFTSQKQYFSFGFDVYQTLFDFGKSISNYKAAKEIVRASEANLESIKRVAVLEFITAYFDLLEADRMIAVAEKQVESLSSYLNDVENLYKQGVVVDNELLPAKVRLADARQKLISARNARDIAAAALNNILSLPLNTRIAVDDVPMQPPELPSMEQAWDTAKTQRQEIVFFADQIKASSLSERAKAVENFPALFADAGYSYSENTYQVHQDNTFLELGAKINFYDGGAAHAQLLRERARRAQLAQQRDKLIEDIKFEIQDSYTGLKNAGEKVAVAKEALGQAEENVRFNRAKYADGSSTATEVLEAIAMQTSAQTNFYTSDYEVKRGYAKFMYSIGMDLALIYERMESAKK